MFFYKKQTREQNGQNGQTGHKKKTSPEKNGKSKPGEAFGYGGDLHRILL